MLIKVLEVTVEKINKGKNPYSIATVAYMFDGQARTQKVVSFANPESFKKVESASPGTMLDVTVTKNDQGYNQWAKVEVSDGSAPEAKSPAAAAATGGKVVGSNYETREERNKRQLHIVRQSSIANAIATLAPGSKSALNPDDVLTVAQAYVDFVYDDSESVLAESFGDSEAVSKE